MTDEAYEPEDPVVEFVGGPICGKLELMDDDMPDRLFVRSPFQAKQGGFVLHLYDLHAEQDDDGMWKYRFRLLKTFRTQKMPNVPEW